MALVEQALRTLVLSSPQVTSLIGNRYYPLVIPVSAPLPAIASQRVSGPREYSHSGFSGLVSSRVQLTCVASTYAQAKTLADAVRRVISGYRGTVDGVSLGPVLVQNETDSFNESASEEANSYLTLLDVLIWHQEETT
jgi:hypothetical protein